MSLVNHRKTSSSGDLILRGPFLNRSFSESLSKRSDDRHENQPVLPCNFRSVSTWVLRLSYTRYGWLWGSSCFMIRTRKRGSYNLAYLIEHKTQYFQPRVQTPYRGEGWKITGILDGYIGWNTVKGIKYYFSNEQWFLKEFKAKVLNFNGNLNPIPFW